MVLLNAKYIYMSELKYQMFTILIGDFMAIGLTLVIPVATVAMIVSISRLELPSVSSATTGP
jgi:hypothetical protein